MQQAFKFNSATPEASAKLPKVEYSFPADPQKTNGIVLVGEAPGAEEAKLGRPFVGRSGQLLDKILQQAEIDRAQCLIANSFRFQPPGNKIDHFFISRRAAQQQSVEIVEEHGQFGSGCCRAEFAGELEHLRDTLATYQKKHGGKIVPIALGRTALWALTGENGLMEKLGKPLPCRLLPTITVIPTFHPSFILRGNWARQDEWLSHFQAAKKFIS